MRRAWARAYALLGVAVTFAACSRSSLETFGDEGDAASDAAPPDAPIDAVTSDGRACVPKTCADLDFDCGPAGDGCGGALDCGRCTAPETCGAGGAPNRCGAEFVCVKKTCADLGFDCGPAGDGCGGALDCGRCALPETCGGGGEFSRCGDHPVCTPRTCAALGFTCGPAGDGCGGALDCGTCVAPETCGGGGMPSVCGGKEDCVPATCASLGFTCGPAGDGCGGALDCGRCSLPQTCGGGGQPSVCGRTRLCTNLCRDEVKCDDGGTTTLTGTVVAGTTSTFLPPGGSPDPIPNVFVYVPNGTPDAFTDGPACGCAPVSGSPLAGVGATTDYLGRFTLTGVPVPPGGVVPLVIQLGKWRRVFGLGNVNNPGFPVTACAINTAGSVRLPRNQGEGDIPKTAVSTGEADHMECLLRKMGVDDAEFTDPGGTGRIQLFEGNGAVIDKATPPETTLLPKTIDPTELAGYDEVILPCWGEDPRKDKISRKTPDQQANLVTYANAGGRAFATHYSYAWLYDDAPFSATATWLGDPHLGGDLAYDAGTAVIQQPSPLPDVNTFYSWMNALPASGAAAGQFPLENERNDFSMIASSAELWINVTGATPAIGGYPTSFPVTFTFDTPVATPPACGRVIYSDFHVINGAVAAEKDFPKECNGDPMTPQEKSLEYLIWDLVSCPPTPPGPPCTPATCEGLGFDCGPAGDGCGGALDCGACSGCQTCGGGGKPGVCGGICCVPETCESQHVECGPAGDGCGGTLQCGSCPKGQTCGAEDRKGTCGPIDAGLCVPATCASLGYDCGPAGDGCGGLLDCGACTAPATCGGAGQFSRCGDGT